MPDKTNFQTVIEGPREPVMVSISEFKGHTYISVRHWYWDQRTTPPELKPSPKGITVDLEYLDDIVGALELCQKFRDGELPGESEKGGATQS